MLLDAVWIAGLVVMALLLANPPTLNQAQLVQAPVVIEGKILEVTPQEQKKSYQIEVTKSLKTQQGQTLPEILTLESSATLQPGVSYFLPLSLNRDTIYEIVPAPYGGNNKRDFPRIDMKTAYPVAPLGVDFGTPIVYPATPVYESKITAFLKTAPTPSGWET